MSEEKNATQELREKLLNEPKGAKALSAEEFEAADKARKEGRLILRKNISQGIEYFLLTAIRQLRLLLSAKTALKTALVLQLLILIHREST